MLGLNIRSVWQAPHGWSLPWLTLLMPHSVLCMALSVAVPFGVLSHRTTSPVLHVTSSPVPASSLYGLLPAFPLVPSRTSFFLKLSPPGLSPWQWVVPNHAANAVNQISPLPPHCPIRGWCEGVTLVCVVPTAERLH